MAKGEPPYAELHPMRVLFLIPKADAPTLEGNFSKAFKEFVSLCCQKDPAKRPSAEELLKHRFIKGAKKTSYLTELIERHERWLAEGGKDADDDDDDNSPYASSPAAVAAAAAAAAPILTPSRRARRATANVVVLPENGQRRWRTIGTSRSRARTRPCRTAERVRRCVRLGTGAGPEAACRCGGASLTTASLYDDAVRPPQASPRCAHGDHPDQARPPEELG